MRTIAFHPERTYDFGTMRQVFTASVLLGIEQRRDLAAFIHDGLSEGLADVA
jgi:hypothetical protein